MFNQAAKLIENAVSETLAEIQSRQKYEEIGLKRTAIGEVEQWIVDIEKETTGIDISGFTHEITNHFIIHVLKNHGNPVTEQLRGNVAIDNDDFTRIPEILEKPDITCFGVKRRTRGKAQKAIIYIKNAEDRTILLFEAILMGKRNKTLRGITFLKKKTAVTPNKMYKILEADKQNDISTIKVVVGAGGQTGSEAT